MQEEEDMDEEDYAEEEERDEESREEEEEDVAVPSGRPSRPRHRKGPTVSME